MKLSQLKAETKTITVSFDAGDLKVKYRPNAFTADAADKVREAMADESKQTEGMFQMIRTMIAEWDLEDENGEVVPLDDVTRIRAEVPMGVFGRIFAAMNQDQNPGEAVGRS